MPQLHLYVSEDVADKLKRRAEQTGLSVSRYLAELAMRDAEGGEWPDGYFETVFGGSPEPLTRPPADEWREREELV